MGLLAVSGALAASGYIAEARAQAASREVPEITRELLRGTGVQTPTRMMVPPTVPAGSMAQRVLESQIQQLGRAFNGDVGIAIRDVRAGWTTAYDGNTFFPQQSVSKFWVSLTALDRADRGLLNMSQSVTLTPSDLTLFHQPIRALIGSNGYTTTLNDLMFRALTQSDNTANDFLLRRAGGPEAVRDFLQRKGITGIRFGPGERLMQSQLAGLQWRPEYSFGNAFYAARSSLPLCDRSGGRSDAGRHRRCACAAAERRTALADLDATNALHHVSDAHWRAAA
jgi:beta-lactamase class A